MSRKNRIFWNLVENNINTMFVQITSNLCEQVTCSMILQRGAARKFSEMSLLPFLKTGAILAFLQSDVFSSTVKDCFGTLFGITTVHFTPHPSGFLHWHWGNQTIASEATLRNMGESTTWIQQQNWYKHKKTKNMKTMCIFYGISFCLWLVINQAAYETRPPRQIYFVFS